jgi:hypothetical protein
VDARAHAQAPQSVSRLLQEQRLHVEQDEQRARQRLAQVLHPHQQHPQQVAEARSRPLADSLASFSMLPDSLEEVSLIQAQSAANTTANTTVVVHEMDDSDVGDDAEGEAAAASAAAPFSLPPQLQQMAAKPPPTPSAGARQHDSVAPDSEDMSYSRHTASRGDDTSQQWTRGGEALRHRREFEESEVSLMQSIRGLRSRVAENQSLADRSFAAPPPPPHDGPAM